MLISLYQGSAIVVRWSITLLQIYVPCSPSMTDCPKTARNLPETARHYPTLRVVLFYAIPKIVTIIS